MAFVDDPKRKSGPPQTNKSQKGETNNVKDVLPTRNGIYKHVPSSPARTVPAPATKVKKKKPVQFSSRAKEESTMRKNVK